jgi:hypothetical protein
MELEFKKLGDGRERDNEVCLTLVVEMMVQKSVPNNCEESRHEL